MRFLLYKPVFFVVVILSAALYLQQGNSSLFPAQLVAGQETKPGALRGADGQAVEYGKLVVRDNLGRTIPARLTVAEQQVVIEVEDAAAAYPLTIDPLFTLQQRLTAADGAANDYLGYAVALDGDTRK